MKIDLPQLHNFDKDRLAPSNEKLASFTVGQLPKNISKHSMFMTTSKKPLFYQKLRDRYEYLRRLEPLTPCDPKCQEGWYWDCETETCKEYSFYSTVATYKSNTLLSYETTTPLSGGGYKVSIIDCEIVCPYSLTNFFQTLEGSNLSTAITGGGVSYPAYRVVNVISSCNLSPKSIYNGYDGDLLYDGEASVITTIIGTPSYSGECEYLGSNIGLIKVRRDYSLKVYGVK